jgi:integrase
MLPGTQPLARARWSVLHPKLVQELLGHATIAMTIDTYSHYLPSMGDQAAGAMGEALGQLFRELC